MRGVRTADRRTLALIDGLAAFWVVFWLVVAGTTAYEVWSLSTLSDSAQISAQAVDQAGEALQEISELPLVPDQPGELGTQIRAAAADVDESAERTRQTVHRLSVLLGVTIFFLPTTPLWLYLPARARRRREVSAIASQLGPDGRADAALEAYLAHRALATVPYHHLRRLSDDPAKDLAHGRHERLAQAELSRLGLRRGTG